MEQILELQGQEHALSWLFGVCLGRMVCRPADWDGGTPPSTVPLSVCLSVWALQEDRGGERLAGD